ncbi:hypothetical protein MBH78_14330 [Oceanimonas sp. NS1]|nr:hypothetical protein [Oceanimonas sp. NS1]
MRTPIAMNRGTENNMTVFAGGKASAWEVAAPGQSGFIAPDGTLSPTTGISWMTLLSSD